MNLLLLLQVWTDERLAYEIEQVGSTGKIAHALPFILWFVAGVALLAVVFSLVSMFKNPASLKNFVIGLVSIALVAGISYLLAEGSIPEGFDVSESVARFVSAGIIMTIILIGLGLLTILWGVIKGILK